MNKRRKTRWLLAMRAFQTRRYTWEHGHEWFGGPPAMRVPDDGA